MYLARRDALLNRIEGSVAIFCAPRESIRNDDVHHDFRQDSDLYYLTGFEEPESVLVLSRLRRTHLLKAFSSCVPATQIGKFGMDLDSV